MTACTGSRRRCTADPLKAIGDRFRRSFEQNRRKRRLTGRIGQHRLDQLGDRPRVVAELDRVRGQFVKLPCHSQVAGEHRAAGTDDRRKGGGCRNRGVWDERYVDRGQTAAQFVVADVSRDTQPLGDSEVTGELREPPTVGLGVWESGTRSAIAGRPRADAPGPQRPARSSCAGGSSRPYRAPRRSRSPRAVPAREPLEVTTSPRPAGEP